jgi:hypothetical protein
MKAQAANMLMTTRGTIEFLKENGLRADKKAAPAVEAFAEAFSEALAEMGKNEVDVDGWVGRFRDLLSVGKKSSTKVAMELVSNAGERLYLLAGNGALIIHGVGPRGEKADDLYEGNGVLH